MMSNNPEYRIYETNNGLKACYNTNIERAAWQSTNVLATTLPLFLLQLWLFLFTNRFLLFLLKPLRQPLVVSQIISGVLLGPAVLGRIPIFEKHIFPHKTTLLLSETFGNLALVYYAFLIGLEMDLTLITITNTEKKALGVAISGILLPFCIGFGLFFLLYDSFKPNGEGDIRGSIFWGISLAATNVSDVAGVLTKLKLLRSDIGLLALSSSVISDFWIWTLLAVAVSILNANTFYAVLSTFGFALFCVLVVRPTIPWIIRHTRKSKEENFDERHIWLLLGWIVFFGLITDGCGSQSIFGSFMLGVIIPRGERIRSQLMERMDDFVSWLMMPFFFLTSGLRSDILFMLKETPWHVVVLVVCLSLAAKIVSALLVSLFCKMTIQEGMALGLIMNTRGVLPLIIINIGRNIKALNNQTFPLMVFALLIMTCLSEPILGAMYKYKPQMIRYSQRSIRSVVTSSAQFRILACIHSTHDLSSTISLLEASNPSKESPIYVIAVHLVELVGRSAAMLIVHDQYKEIDNNFSTASTKKTESKQIMDAFKSYETRNGAVLVEKITALSPYETMNVDICSLAEEKRVAFIILPFQISETSVDDIIETDATETSSSFTEMNQYVLENAPCSVGLLVDRGLSSNSLSTNSVGKNEKCNKGFSIAMIFIGGPDDREALAYAWRMAEHPRVSLTVIRFLLSKDAMELNPEDSSSQDEGILDTDSRNEAEKRLDGEFIYEFMFKTRDNESVNYIEKVVNNGNETVAAIREKNADYDLYIVGRGNRFKSPLTSGLSDWASCQELGALGDTLASSNFASQASVLVVQKYVAKNKDSFRVMNQTALGSSPRHPLMDSSNKDRLQFSNKDNLNDDDHDKDDDDDDT